MCPTNRHSVRHQNKGAHGGEGEGGAAREGGVGVGEKARRDGANERPQPEKTRVQKLASIK